MIENTIKSKYINIKYKSRINKFLLVYWALMILKNTQNN